MDSENGQNLESLRSNPAQNDSFCIPAGSSQPLEELFFYLPQPFAVSPLKNKGIFAYLCTSQKKFCTETESVSALFFDTQRVT